MIDDNYSPTKVSGNGVTEIFTGSWAIFKEDWLVVQFQDKTTGNLSTKVLGTDYQISSFDNSGFVVDFSISTAPPSTVYVICSRDVPLSQTEPYSTSSGFEGADEETSFDILTAITQQLQEQEDRAPHLPIGTAGVDLTLPLPSAGKALKWNPSANGLINSTYDPDTQQAGAAASATAAASSASAAAASAAAAALAAANLSGTSTTSNSIATGTKTFTTQSGKTFNGQNVRVYSSANNANFMDGLATYSGTTLSVAVTATGGSGTHTDWIIQVNGARGATGPSGTLSDGNYGAFSVSSSVATMNADSVTESDQLLSDNTTNDVSTSKHGYAPKAPNDATQFLNGVGAYSVPTSGGQLNRFSSQTSGNFTTPSNITTSTVFLFRLTGGGGGGGGSGSIQAASGGSAAATMIKKLSGLSPLTAYAYVIGNGGTPSTDGQDSTLTVGATTYTAGKGFAGVSGGSVFAGGVDGGTAINGDDNIKGGGSSGAAANTGSSGGASYWGGGGRGDTNGAGDGAAPGSGGGGAGGDSGGGGSGGTGAKGIFEAEWCD